jgi:hypothetical protein
MTDKELYRIPTHTFPLKERIFPVRLTVGIFLIHFSVDFDQILDSFVLQLIDISIIYKSSNFPGRVHFSKHRIS